MKSITYAGVLFLSLGMGCSSSGGSSPIPIDAIGSEFSETACEYFASCPFPGVASATFASLADNPGSAGSCGDLLSGSFGAFDAYEAAVDRGSVIYDGAAASRCLSAMSRHCVPPSALLAVESDCLDVFQGTVAPGGACLLDEECAGDARCVATVEGTCGGTCVARVALGGSCVEDAECSAVLGGTTECTTTAANAEPHCVITRYVAVGAGDQCGATDVDGDEQVAAYCGPDLYCKMTLGADTGTCSHPLAIGAPCNALADACEAGAACAGSGSTTCRAITIIEKANVACDPASLILCNPLDRLDCTDSVCAVIGDGTAGASCRGSFGTDCNDGLYCAVTLAGSTCQPRVPEGQPCGLAGDASCATGYCDESDPLDRVCATSVCL